MSGILCAYSFTVRANGLFLGVIYLLDLYHFIKNKNPEQIIWSIISGSLLFFTFLGTNIYHYVTFCPGRGEWCDRLLPSMFQYAQEHYWNVGFLKYWTLNNIPNFILVGPVLIFNVYSVMFMYKELPRHWKLGPLILINTLTVIGGVFFWNTQILNRVTSFSPLLYWTLAANLLETKRWARYAVVYCVMWSFVQTVLFAGFLPPA
ncbi:hypothetical protein G210_2808 [Candida maltosa Xu316]|uniref:GPI mannosyltransferase 2 n=1 Tax=Candida maltosa (strain Xu316) TaxID=1245528 RepID=M3JVI5_CANMX|nr:hypothetical protein G210_2808 [Candida maltosa Xu316]